MIILPVGYKLVNQFIHPFIHIYFFVLEAPSNLLFPLFPLLLRYNWYMTLCKFKVYNVLVWYASILQHDYHLALSNTSSHQLNIPSPPFLWGGHLRSTFLATIHIYGMLPTCQALWYEQTGICPQSTEGKVESVQGREQSFKCGYNEVRKLLTNTS